MRLATLGRLPGFRNGKVAADAVASLYQRGQAHGLVEVRQEGLGQLVYFRDPETWYGEPAVIGFLDVAPHEEGLAFVLDAVERHAEELDETTFLQVAPDEKLLEGLVARGFGLDSVLLGGVPRLAAARLRPVAAPSEMKLLPTRGREQRVDFVNGIHRSVFSAEPEYCWFGAYPRHLERVRQMLLRQDGQFAIVEGERVIGHLGVDVRNDPMWGRTGGLELLLLPEYRGRGLARWLYREALAFMVAEGAVMMMGGTAQPPVLHLARELGRPWIGFNIRRKTRFPPEHFLRFRDDHSER
jgi:GNAT superfamily N-acetyltransferase